MCIVRGRVVRFRVRSYSCSKRIGVDSCGQLHADLDADIDSQHINDHNDSFVESSTRNDVHTARGRIFLVVVCTSNVQNRRDTSSHFSGADDRGRSQCSGHRRRRL